MGLGPRQKFSDMALASEAVTSLLIPRVGLKARHCHIEEQEDKKRWKSQEALGPPEKAEEEMQRPKLALGLSRKHA